jgi:hypothetical protein
VQEVSKQGGASQTVLSEGFGYDGALVTRRVGERAVVVIMPELRTTLNRGGVQTVVEVLKSKPWSRAGSGMVREASVSHSGGFEN